MTLQVLPPELLGEGQKDKIEKAEPQPYWKPSSLKDGESEEFRLLGCYETGHAIMGWQYPSEIADPKTGELRFNGFVVTRSYPTDATDIARETDWSKPDRPKIDGTSAKPRKFLAWVATSASRARLEVLFIEQRSIRDQLTEILQEIEDYTWTKDGLANFSIKISRKGSGLETSYSILPKVRKVPEKIVKQWASEKDAIWLPNFFEGKDPFAGKQTDAKGLPAGGTDKRGSTVLPKQKQRRLTTTTNSEPFPHIVDQTSTIVFVVARNWLTATSAQQWTNTNYPGYRTQFITSQTFEEKLHNLQ